MPTMEQSGQYPNVHSRQHLFQSPQLPPPSQLQLPPSSFRSNTLPPIPNFPSSSQPHRFPPVTSFPTAPQVLPPLPSPPASQGTWSTLHRTSNSREEIRPSQQHHRSSRTDLGIKHEPGSSHRPLHHEPQQQQLVQQTHPVKDSAEDGMPSTSDFVKKLYKMLEDQSFQHVVQWGPQGDCFVVKDMNEFTKSILPRMFKHSNFASFVRQLNKYDFHKVKNTEDNQFGEHSWTFRHPDFHADRRDGLENIKRKVPTQRKPASTSHTHPSNPSTSPGPGPYTTSPSSATIDALQAQVERLTQAQEDMSAHVRSLERNYQEVLGEMVNCQRNMAQQDGLMHILIQYFLQIENGKIKAQTMAGGTRTGTGNRNGGAIMTEPSSSSQNQPQNQTQNQMHDLFLAAQEAHRMMGGSYIESEVAHASLVQMNEISRRAEVLRMSSGAALGGVGVGAEVGGGGEEGEADEARDPARMLAAAAELMGWDSDLNGSGKGMSMSREDTLARIEELHRARPLSAQGLAIAETVVLNGFETVVNEHDGFVMPNAEQVGVGPSEEVPVWSGSGGTGADASTETGSGDDACAGTTGDVGTGELAASTHQGLQVYTLGHLMPKGCVVDQNGNWCFDPNALGRIGMDVTDTAPVSVTTADTSALASSSGYGLPEQPLPETTYAHNDEPVSLATGVGAPTPPSDDIVPTGGQASSSSQKLRVRRSTFVPGWAVPPRVLLVDDDAVSRRLSSKFLQVFGCTIDVAVDGIGAVHKMNLEKYDLVLMDIVMPKLDGVSATSLIRQFDHMTPIISMTSNSKPNEIMTYYSSGMNDILPKPFTKEGLLDMLEKHLMHLKVIQQMSKVPRSVGVPPLSDDTPEQDFISQTPDVSTATTPAPPPSDPTVPLMSTGGGNIVQGGNGGGGGGMVAIGEDVRINPLAGMGVTDEQYAAILHNLVNGESMPSVAGMNIGIGVGLNDGGVGEKRALDDPGDGRDGKRSRFELVE